MWTYLSTRQAYSMSMTFTKLFSSITESTIWDENSDTRIVWVTMLAMADRWGRVFGSIPGLANRSRVSIQKVREALEVFKSPDPESRTKVDDGRRIRDIDGGWFLINHGKYRALRDEDERRMYKAEKQRQYRSRGKSVDNSGQSGPPLTSVERSGHNADADADTEIKNSSPKKSVLEEIYTAYPRHVGKAAALRAIETAIRKIEPRDPQWLLGQVRAYQEQRRGEDEKFTPHPATWFNRGSYDDDNLKPKAKMAITNMDGTPFVPNGRPSELFDR